LFMLTLVNPVPPVSSEAGARLRFCFEGASWPTTFRHTVLLRQVFRQSDPTFFAFLVCI